MTQEHTHAEKTSADGAIAGFDYQYYFFLWKLLSLEHGQSVGLEVKDDVHTQLNESDQILFQLKHSIKKKADGTPINLTASDLDLWKTLSNWSQIIADKKDGRHTSIQQLKFIKKTSFVLASNKSESSTNTILKLIIEFKESNCIIDTVITEFKNLRDKTKSDDLKKYINIILLLKKDVLKEFLLKVCFQLNENEIIEKCRLAIRSDKIKETKIDQVFAGVDSAIREDNFIKIKNDEKTQITFDDFYKKYKKFYDIARNESLTINEFRDDLPDNLESQTFIQQLVEIHDVELSDIEEIAELSRFKLKLENNIKTWTFEGEITKDEVNSFNKEAILQWKNIHKSSNRNIVGEIALNNAGLKVLDSIRLKKLFISGQDLDTEMSNGAFYGLSDKPYIGWRKDWEKYKK